MKIENSGSLAQEKLIDYLQEIFTPTSKNFTFGVPCADKLNGGWREIVSEGLCLNPNCHNCKALRIMQEDILEEE